jgi:hypothetical protein
MKVLLVVAVVVLMFAGMAAYADAPAVQLMSGGPVYVMPLQEGSPFVGGLLTLHLPQAWGAWTDYIQPAAVIRTGGVANASALCPAIAVPIQIGGTPAAFVGVTYAGAGVHSAVFAGVDLVVLFGLH